MRYFSALYFLIRPFLVTLYVIRAVKVCNMFFYVALSFASVTLVIAYLKPYKKAFMNLSDIVLLALFTLLCLLSGVNLRYTFVGTVTMIILFLSPLFVFFIVISARLIRKLKAYLVTSNCRRNITKESDCETSNIMERRRLFAPLQSKMLHYGDI